MDADWDKAAKRGWRLNCWRLSVVNLLVGMSFYLQIPFLSRVLQPDSWAAWPDALLWFGGCYVAGMFLPGPFCNYWLDAYRRLSVCRWSIWLLLISSALLYWVVPVVFKPLYGLPAGMAMGLFQMSAGSTLLVDLSPSDCRTLASHLYYWLSRLALGLGPVLSLLVTPVAGLQWLPWLSLLCGGVALLVLLTVEVPFRTPLEPKMISLDRFWMPRAFRLFSALFPLAFAVGFQLPSLKGAEWYALMLVGLLVALLFHRLFRRMADVRYEAVWGMMLISLACLFRLLVPSDTDWPMIAFVVLLSAGLGSAVCRYLLFFVRIARHCERGTAQTTYMLAWEGGLLFGVSVGLWSADAGCGFLLPLLSVCVAWGVYSLFVHRWIKVERGI
ncbi:MAG: MFS transporter [Clostridium sp.]|nr:MFS transporter [Clostridium sp.]